MEHGHHSCCQPVDDHASHSHQGLLRKTIVAAILGAFLMFIYMLGIIPPLGAEYGFTVNAILATITLAGMTYTGSQYYLGAWRAFLQHAANMDTLIALGTISAFIYSCAVLIFTPYFPANTQHVYFEAIIVIIAFVNLGMYLEMRARKQSAEAINNLLNLQPKTARVIRESAEIDVPLAALQVHDLIRVRPGEQIAVDGIITEGSGLIDESMLTGEPVPQHKSAGMLVTGGTINKTGSFIFQAKKIGKDTVLAQIVALVQTAQNSKPQLARLADQISYYFVPLVMIFAIITAMVWYNVQVEPVGTFMFVTAVSVLVIACPCALGLAVPISVMIGIAKAAQYGILIRDAQALQQMSKITTIVLDKTGTITKGQPRVINITAMPGNDIKTILLIAASLEVHSEHPYAQAIVQAARIEHIAQIQANNFSSIAGLGVSGEINGEPVALGNASFMAAQLVATDGLQEAASQSAKLGQTLIYVAKNKQLLGGISIADPIRDGAKEIVARLLANNIKVVMITGDNYHTAQAVAASVGISNVTANVMPQEKAAQIEALQSEDEIVAMVGDGINDAIALARADVGIAMGSGTDIAMQSADITIINSNLQSILTTIELSKATVTNMRQNLFAAFIYNILGIPIAAGILYPLIGALLNPMFASVAMALSSFTVVANANRLRLYKTLS